MNHAEYLIKELNLQPHPEGGYFKEVYRSTGEIDNDSLDSKYIGNRNYATSIYFLLISETFSAFHKINQDEIWHFYDGSKIIIYQIDRSGQLAIEKLGKEKDSNFQITIKKGTWFAAEPDNEKLFSLFGCTVSPGFDFEDFKLGKCEELVKKFPEHESLINRLTNS